MAKRHDLPKIQPRSEPTYWNHGISKGFVLGTPSAAIIGGLLGMIGGPGGAAIGALAGTAIGAIAGPIYGSIRRKNRMEQESQEGKTVKDPTFWNDGLFTGASVGLLMAVALTAATNLFGGPGLISDLVSLTTIIGSTVYTGLSRKSEMQKDVQLAETMRAEQAMGLGLGRAHQLEQVRGHQPSIQHSRGQPYVNATTPEDYALMQAQMRNDSNPERNFAQEIAAKRSAPAQQAAGEVA